MTAPAIHSDAPSCASCRFFNASMQTCQQSSPKLFFKSGSADSVFPGASPDGWCGQWQITWPGVWPPARSNPSAFAVTTLADSAIQKLIEGAPALLEVAEDFYRLERERGVHCGCSEAQRREGHRSACIMHDLVAAIAKATGRQVVLP